ncbi:hypothetical protein [Catenovulum maritimum]|uniref:Zn-ribbon protein n=1 Tax=Catenovulum maritimum TaxID=1513271 RepID=A0A0J8JKG7_9ALTE|nr:hypothetical protein [Catenovulum maritimum]KMT64966.1 hypothetical protein XM47_11685 [Catenovulum maritimum]
MALISCPQCRQKISDKAEQCSKCDYVLLGDPEKLDSQRRILRIKQSSKLMTHSFLFLLLFIGSIAYSSWYAESGDSWDKMVSLGLTAVGLIGYLVSRIRIMMFKREN